MDVTAWVLVAAVFAVAIADFFLLDRYGPAGTISVALLSLARQYPIIPFTAGLLAGHLFWPQNGAGTGAHP